MSCDHRRPYTERYDWGCAYVGAGSLNSTTCSVQDDTAHATLRAMSSVVRVWRVGALLCAGCALTFACAIGCGESSGSSKGAGDGDDAGAGGTDTSGGNGGTSGSATGGVGASSGSATGGSAGDAGAGGPTSGGTSSGGTSSGGTSSGGMAGSGAGEGGTAGGGQPECQTAEDCRMVSDCCGCRSEPVDAPTFCALPCERDACAEIMVDSEEVECVFGRCVIARSCDSQVGCPALPPNCPEGTVPSVLDDCWGPCLPPTECRTVSGCAACGDAFCVEFQAQRSVFHCVTRVDQCDLENYCECLGVCGECSETDDQVACPCLGC
jgi:hypothetical protein